MTAAEERSLSQVRSMKNLRRQLRYRFDNALSRGTWAVLLWLGAATVVTLLVSSVLLTLFGVELGGSEDGSWLEGFWQSTMRILDPGTMSGDVGWGRRLLALLVTMFGVLIAGTLIGIIAAGVEMRLEAMQRGRSEIVESDHVVILGASPRLAGVVEQLALAGRSRRQNVIVILANREPAELSHEIRDATSDLHGARLVFRWGDPTSVADSDIVALHAARSVIVLADDDAGDSDAVKSVLAIGVALGGHGAVPVVVELGDAQVAQSLVQACGKRCIRSSLIRPIARRRRLRDARPRTDPGHSRSYSTSAALICTSGACPNSPARGSATRSWRTAVPSRSASCPPTVRSSSARTRDLVVDGSTRLVYIADDDNRSVASPSSSRPNRFRCAATGDTRAAPPARADRGVEPARPSARGGAGRQRGAGIDRDRRVRPRLTSTVMSTSRRVATWR